MNFHRICKVKYKTYYILKCDISKFFASIDHDILKKKLEFIKVPIILFFQEENKMAIMLNIEILEEKLKKEFIYIRQVR